jgi:hypothetical protein
VTAFADPAVQFGLGFQAVMPEATPEATIEATDAAPEPADRPSGAPTEPPTEAPQVVSLDAFRRRPPPKK